MVVYLMVSTYITCCVLIATKPCKYFQLNSPSFDSAAGIFSKLRIDELIPPPWRLEQWHDDGVRMPESYPVFVKPEWSQNAKGIFRADSPAQLQQIRANIQGMQFRYLLQAGAQETNEYEVFSMQQHRDKSRYQVLTVTQACNPNETNPINSIYNENTEYVEITESFSVAQRDAIWALVRRIGSFPISRVSVRANSTEDLLLGKFHIIEVNLFLPMPINMLDRRHTPRSIFVLVMTYMLHLARITKTRDQTLPTKPVFIKSMLYNRRSALLNFWRRHL